MIQVRRLSFHLVDSLVQFECTAHFHSVETSKLPLGATHALDPVRIPTDKKHRRSAPQIASVDAYTRTLMPSIVCAYNYKVQSAQQIGETYCVTFIERCEAIESDSSWS